MNFIELDVDGKHTTLRDKIAMSALNGIFCATKEYGGNQYFVEVSRAAYRLADEMLKARSFFGTKRQCRNTRRGAGRVVSGHSQPPMLLGWRCGYAPDYKAPRQVV